MLAKLSLRAKILLYLGLIHLVLAAICWFVLRQKPLLLFAVEGLFALSVALGVQLVRAFFVPLDLIRTGAELIGERDFTSAFRDTGQPEMDALVRVYNRMIGRLREERLKLEEQHYFLERVLSASPAGVVTLDFDGRVSLINPSGEKLLGTTAAAIMGHHLSAAPERSAGPEVAGAGPAGELGAAPGFARGAARGAAPGGAPSAEPGFAPSAAPGFALGAAPSAEPGSAPSAAPGFAPSAAPGFALGAALAAIPAGLSRILPLVGGRRLKVSRAEFFDRGFPRSFFLLEELTEELRASEKAAYGKLIRMMSHEVNNSVGAVGSLLDSFRGYAEQLHPGDSDDLLQSIAVAVTRLENLRSFTNGFAEVVRLPPPDLRPADPRQLVDELLLLLRPELERRRIQCAWAEAQRVRAIAMDRNQIEQVLVNVLRNAIEAIGEEGRIILRLTLEAGRPVLAISDSGSGIEASVLPLLFTPFFSTKKNGRGLGLTLVQEILSQHGFGFSLEAARGGGRGAEFRLEF